MGYGPVLPDGFLTALSVGSEREARALLVLSCPTNVRGQFIAVELAREQTFARLETFGERLQGMHDQYFKGTPRCDCTYEGGHP